MTDGSIRVSDAERDHVVAALQEHFTQGRLSLDELHERVADAYTSTTRADLHRLTIDLPDPDVGVPTDSHRASTGVPPRPHVRLVPVVLVVAVLVGCVIPFAYLGIVPVAAVCVLLAYRHDSGRWPRWLVSATTRQVNQTAHRPMIP